MMIKFLTNSVAKKYEGKTCLLRIDLNIEPGAPLDSHRVNAVVPTIKLLLKNRIKVVILSHRGRPKIGNKELRITNNGLSLKPFARVLSIQLGRKVNFLDNFNFEKIKSQIDESEPGSVFLMENLRFLPGEEKNDVKLAKQLASLAGDFYPHTKRGARLLHKNSLFGVGVYVNDAFAVSHRKNASVCAITKYLPSYAGLLMKKEIKNLGGIVDYTTHPFVVVLGGAKLKEKIYRLRNLIRKADAVLLGSSAFNESGIPRSPKIIWPEDAKSSASRRNGTSIWDIGSFTVNHYASVIGKARTIIWNGPPGFFEKKGFEKGTIGIWKAVLANKKARIVIGGGETLASLSLIHNSRFVIPGNIFLSTGGGAMLECLNGKKLPGIEVLKH